MQRRILHLDMDAFYASVEELDDPSLAGKAVIVGGRGARSVVCACSYEARRFDVRSAMPMRTALERCPDAIRLSPRMERYRALSGQIFDFLRRQTPLVEKTSVDEGYLDMSEQVSGDGEALELGRRIQAGIAERFGLPCSIGIAPCKFIAKIASDLRKPKALVLVSEDEVLDFLEPLDVERIPGIGAVGRRKLHAISVRTIGDLRRQSREMLTSMFGKWGARLYDFARGIDPRPVVTEHERKSLGFEKTFETDVRELELLRQTLAAQARKVAAGLQRANLSVRTVTVKVRYTNFQTMTRQQSFPRPVRDADEIAAVAWDQLGRTEAHRRPVRLVGLSVSNFVEDHIDDELPLFAAEE